MLEKLGGIIKLNRLQKNVKLKYISQTTHISASQLSRIERNKENISFEKAKQIFEAMNIQTTEEDINEDFEKDFLRFYDDVAYMRNFEESYQQLKKYEQVIQSSFSYVKYILAEMIYNIASHKTSKKYLFLQDYFDYLEIYQKQLFYDYLGLIEQRKTNYQKSMYYFQLAESYKGTLVSQSMLYYHICMSLNHLRNLHYALEYANKARELFSSTLNLMRLTSVDVVRATIYANKGNFKESEALNLRCLQAFQKLNVTHEIKVIYNNLLWCYVQSGQYQKVIDLKDDILSCRNDHCINFYISFAYYKLGYYQEAKHYIKHAKLCMIEPSIYMNAMIETFYVYLSYSGNERKERYLLNLLESVSFDHDMNLEIFVLNLIIEFYQKINNSEKEYEYTQKVLDFYKNKHF